MDMYLRLLDYGLYQAYKTLGAFETAYDVKNTEEEIVFTMGIPGLVEEDVDIKIREGKRFIIKSKRHSKFTPPFSYVFSLPCRINKDETYASVKNGILEVHLKKEKADEFNVKLM